MTIYKVEFWSYIGTWEHSHYCTETDIECWKDHGYKVTEHHTWLGAPAQIAESPLKNETQKTEPSFDVASAKSNFGLTGIQ